MKRYPSDIMATCCVPWSETWEFMEDIFRHQVHNMLTQGTKHLYLFGTAGEGYAMTDRMFDRVVGVFADEMRKGSAEPMVGIISLSLPIIQERIQRCRDMGVKRFQISLPSWGALNEKELFTFFRETCGRFTDCQFLHYNLMRTKRLVTPAEYGRLAKEHPNLVATKNCIDDMTRIEALIEAAPELQHFLGETGFVHGCQVGECGMLISLASTNWKMARKFFDAAKRKDVATTIPLLKEINGITDGLISSVGDAAHIDGAFDKLFCKIHDPRFPIRMLPPYESAGDSHFQKFANYLKERYPQWLP